MNGINIENPNPERWWRHRRWMGWWGVAGMFLSLCFYLILALFVETGSLEAIRPAVMSSIWAHLGLASVYAGGATLVDAMTKLRSVG